MRVEKCPDCGSRRLGEGAFSGYANLSGRGFRSSKVTAVVCSDCGLIVELRAAQPEKFAPREK